MNLFDWARLDSMPAHELVRVVKSYSNYIKYLEASKDRLQKATNAVSCVIATNKETNIDTCLNVTYVIPTHNGLVIQVELP